MLLKGCLSQTPLAVHPPPIFLLFFHKRIFILFREQPLSSSQHYSGDFLISVSENELWLVQISHVNPFPLARDWFRKGHVTQILTNKNEGNSAGAISGKVSSLSKRYSLQSLISRMMNPHEGEPREAKRSGTGDLTSLAWACPYLYFLVCI